MATSSGQSSTFAAVLHALTASAVVCLGIAAVLLHIACKHCIQAVVFASGNDQMPSRNVTTYSTVCTGSLCA